MANSVVYESLLNDKIQFLQGTQKQLNFYLPNASTTYEAGNVPDGKSAGDINTYRGHAIEGAFYLTTDTHKLYVGRKVTTVPNPNPHNIAANEIYPELVSAGLSTVKNTTELAAAAATANNGDIYYVTEGNILAVFEAGESANGSVSGGWVQINASTGISSFGATTADDSVNGGVKVTHTIEANNTPDQTAVFTIKGSSADHTSGNNYGAVSVTQSSGVITVKATDTTSALGTNTSSSSGVIKLTESDGSSPTTVTLTGSNNVKITSTDAGAISVSGATIDGVNIGNNSTAGWDIGVLYTPPGASQTESSSGTLNPTIALDSTATDTNSVNFINGTATLPVYTKAQTDTAITNAINSSLQVADAMTYKGTIDSSTSLPTNSSHNAKNGDTYKVTTQFSFGSNPTVTVYPGDLIIVKGTEATSGDYVGYITSNISYDVVPAGDEPLIAPNHTASNAAATTASVFGLYDGKYSDAANHIIAQAKFTKKDSTQHIQIDSAVEDNGKTLTITAKHIGSAATVANDKSASTSTGDDSIGSGKKEFYVLPASFTPSGSSTALVGGSNIVTDSTGHVTNVNAAKIVLEHNKVQSVAFAESVANDNKSATLQMTVADKYASTNDSTTFASDTLKFTKSGDNINFDLVWGSF